MLRWPVIDGARSALKILPFASHPRLGGSPLLQAQGPTHNPAYMIYMGAGGRTAVGMAVPGVKIEPRKNPGEVELLPAAPAARS